jgi:hypothetical protein
MPGPNGKPNQVYPYPKGADHWVTWIGRKRVLVRDDKANGVLQVFMTASGWRAC